MIKLSKPNNTKNFPRSARKIPALLLTIAVTIFSGSLISMTASAQAAEKVYDYGGLLTVSEERELEQQLSEASGSCGHEIIVYTVGSLDGYTAGKRAEKAADDIGAGSSGILYLVAINDREYDIFTFGEMDRIISSSQRDRLAEKLRPYLSKGDYYGAFTEFGRQAQTIGSAGGIHTGFEFSPAVILGSALASLIIVLSMKAGMKTTRPEITAGNYVRKGSFRLTGSRDVFLYSSLSRRKIQSGSSGSHRHSGGHSGGKF